jgi:hypothetical protein
MVKIIKSPGMLMKRANSADSDISFIAPFSVDNATQWQLVVFTKEGVKTFWVDEKVIKKSRDIGVIKPSLIYSLTKQKKEMSKQ